MKHEWQCYSELRKRGGMQAKGRGRAMSKAKRRQGRPRAIRRRLLALVKLAIKQPAVACV